MGYGIKRGNIFYVSRTPVIGHEQFSGRPAIIVSNNVLNKHTETVEVVYLTTQPKRDFPTHVPIRSAKYPSIALCEQVTTVSTERLGDLLGSCTADEMQAVDLALMESIGLGRPNDESAYEHTDDCCPRNNTGAEAKRELAIANAERDIYKAMYEQLLSKVVRSA